MVDDEMTERSPAMSRRGFLAGMAAAPLAAMPLAAGPLAAALGGPAPAVGPPRRALVVGAGAFGGWTALALRRRGLDVTLVDAWGPGNSRSSSGGESRVIRAVYGPDRLYVEMVRRSFELWGELESAVGERLYTETGALWMVRGDAGYVESALPILAELGFPVERPSLAEGARRWPQIDLSGVDELFLEPRAGVLAARRACRAVRDRLVDEGGRYRTAAVRSPEAAGVSGEGRLAAVETVGGEPLAADAFVFACGPWLGRLFPEAVGGAVRPTRQEVYYFGLPAGSTEYAPPRLPVWIDFGERIFYGLPDTGGRGFKVADDTRGDTVDPSSLERRPSPEGVERSRELLASRFPGLAGAPLVEARVCQYENSPDGDLIVDRHPAVENVWLAGGGSGHGFKLSPALGERLAAAVVGEADPPAELRLGRLEGSERSGTQFERGGGDGSPDLRHRPG